MTHKRNGKRAKAARQERARDRKIATEQYFERYRALAPDERLIEAIFGAHEECSDCHNSKLRGTDCQSPHCKAIRGEESVFYDSLDDFGIVVRGARMEAGIDY